jgi:hypothetical protein
MPHFVRCAIVGFACWHDLPAARAKITNTADTPMTTHGAIPWINAGVMRRIFSSLKEQGKPAPAPRTQVTGRPADRRGFPVRIIAVQPPFPSDVGSCIWRGSAKVPAPWFHGIPETAPSIVPPLRAGGEGIGLPKRLKELGVRQIPYSENQ